MSHELEHSLAVSNALGHMSTEPGISSEGPNGEKCASKLTRVVGGRTPFNDDFI